MVRNQATKPCMHIGFEVANRMTNNQYNEMPRKKGAQEARVTTAEEYNAFLTHMNALKCIATFLNDS